MKVGIAGAGLMGRLLAVECATRGWQVTLFDHDDGNGHMSCGFMAAGMIAPYSECEITTPLLIKLGQRSIELWPQFLKKLVNPPTFQFSGSLILAHPQDQVQLTKLEQRYQKIPDVKKVLKVLNDEELKRIEPELPDYFNQALHFPNEGHIVSSELFAALADTLREQQVIWKIKQTVEKVMPHEIQVNDEIHSFDLACDCRGLGAKPQKSILRGVRGELIHLYAPDVKLLKLIRILHPRYAIYVVPRPDSVYVVGATSIESEDFSPISVRSTLELLSAAYAVHPGFAEARILTTAAQCRPAFPDHLPHVRYCEGLLTMNGLYRHGYLSAPALIEDFFMLHEQGLAALRFPELVSHN
jgi:glycine oxidase